MSTNESLKNQVQARLVEIRENTIIVDQIDLFHLADITEGIVTVWASWSGPALVNCIQTIKYLYSLNYPGKIYIVDNDDFNSPEKNDDFFGMVLHGWGEIFVIKDGLITNEFLGKESFSRFKMFLKGDMSI
jgi:hypothetical protein